MNHLADPAMQKAIVKERQDMILGLILDNGYTGKEIGSRLNASPLFRQNGSVAEVKAALENEVRPLRDGALRVLDMCDRLGIQMVFLGDPDYPPYLSCIVDPPAMLFFKGRRDVLSMDTVSIVGARRATPYGKQAAYEIAQEAAVHSWGVVSGLAVGIDGAAHRGAMDAGGVTMAVMPGPVETCYPKSHVWLYRRIMETGVVLSEYAPGTEMKKWHFVERNRIVSGMSRVTIVAQAGVRSGSLITARDAAEQGRDVYCVPGSIYDPEYLGSHRLIQDGANVLTSPGELFSEFGYSEQRSLLQAEMLPRRTQSPEEAAWRETQALRKKVQSDRDKAGEWRWLYEAIDDFGSGPEMIRKRTGKDAVLIQMGLSELEILGLIEHSGSIIVKKREGKALHSGG